MSLIRNHRRDLNLLNLLGGAEMLTLWKIFFSAFCVLIGSSAYGGQNQNFSVIVHKKYDKGFGIGISTSQVYAIVQNLADKKPNIIARFGSFSGNSKKNKLFVSGPVYVIAETSRVSSHGLGGSLVVSGGPSCRNIAKFTPLPGRTYDIVQTVVVMKSCAFSLIDLQTGKSPSDLSIIENKSWGS